MCKWMCKWMGVSDAHPKWMGRVSCVRRHSLSYQAHDGALSGARASSKVSKLSDHKLTAADHELTAAM